RIARKREQTLHVQRPSATIGRFRKSTANARFEARVGYVARCSLKIVIAGINYAPEPTGIAPYTTGLAVGLAQRGHEVLVLTGEPHYPYWKRDKASSRFRYELRMDGLRVRSLSHPVPRRLSWIGRGAMEVTFGLQLLTTRWG